MGKITAPSPAKLSRQAGECRELQLSAESSTGVGQPQLQPTTCWRLSVDKSYWRKLQRDAVRGWPPPHTDRLAWVLPPEDLPGPHNEYQRNPPPPATPALLAGAGENKPLWNMPEYSVLNKACTQEKWPNQRLTCGALTEPNCLGGREILNSSALQPSCST